MKNDRHAVKIHHRVAALARRQHGTVHRQQLLELGGSSGAIAHWVRIGVLHRLHAGVYAVGHRPVSPHAHAMAAVLACGEGAVLSHGSAATLWGMTKTWQTPLEVTARSARRRARLRIHRSRTIGEADRTEHFGIPVTTPARTALDNADGLSDAGLARAINDLRLAGYLKLGDLFELLARHPATAAANRLREHTAHPERAPTRSELEDAFLLFAKRYGLPEPLVNTAVAGFEADIFFPAHATVVELDGYLFHTEREQFESDRNRDAERLAAGIVTVRLTWERMQLTPDQEATRLHGILARRAALAHALTR
ncbi:MAG TPA: type IV toxin-antitoxin system AbiEi family antitoxin domain-containing protein [Solirubrobacteraceae bacterium]|nr:type IV toxin-antitoxin system AbiEi family antitoxin domain-containing protein [Solirubrobacteraceae bacterium]